MRQAARVPRTGNAGFTLAEMIVTLAVLSIVLVAALLLFDFNNRLTRVQSEVAEMQQSLRIGQLDMVRLIRMTGRGGLPPRAPGQLLPSGVAVAVQNNVDPGTQIGDTVGPPVVPGTDVLTIRGVFTSPLFQVNFADAATFDLINGTSEGRVRIQNVSPTGVPQDLTPMAEAIEGANGNNPVAEAVMLVSPLDDRIFAVVELLPGSSTVNRSGGTTGDITDIVVAFRHDDSDRARAYKALNGGAFPSQLSSVAAVGLLEEHRFYIRQDFVVTGDANSDWDPKLTRARVFPGTQVPYRANDNNWRIDISENVFDLQVALGLDTNDDGAVPDTAAANDEWLFNHPADDPTASSWNQVGGVVPARRTPLFYLRVTTLVRTDQRDRNYQAPMLQLVEDHDYTQTPSDRFNNDRERMFRRRQLETVIDLRNL